jgi:hypothetical protein
LSIGHIAVQRLTYAGSAPSRWRVGLWLRSRDMVKQFLVALLNDQLSSEGDD